MAWKIVCFLVYVVMRTLYATYRFRYMDQAHYDKAVSMSSTGAFIFATWHGDSFAGTLAHAYRKCCPLVSQSKDGELVAFTSRRLGLRPVRGSSSRGGKNARTVLLESIHEGYSPAITVDGPKGPVYQCKPGVIDLAKKSGVAILPLCAMPKHYWQLKTWDRLKIPKPFTAIYVFYDEPFKVAPEMTEQEFDTNLEKLNVILKNLVNRAAAHVQPSGHTTGRAKA